MRFYYRHSGIGPHLKKSRFFHLFNDVNRLPLFILIPIAVLFFSSYLWASTVEVHIIHSQDQYQAGGAYPIRIQLKIARNWYIHGPKEGDQGLIPTRLSFDDARDVKIDDIRFPNSKQIKFDYTSEVVDVYSNEIRIHAQLKINKTVQSGERLIQGSLSYQACSPKVCLPPEAVSINTMVKVVPQGTPVKALNAEQFTSQKSADDFEATFPFRRLGSGAWLTLLTIFFGGLALNLTPCIYPLIPITVSYFGGKSETIRHQTLLHGILYLCGLATTNSILGVSAALSGNMLGAVLQNPGMLIIISGIMVALALSFFGLWEIRVPGFLTQMASRNYQGYFGTFFMGLTLGIIAAPCIGPVILGLLVYVGQKGDPILGFLYFFTLSIGMGLPLYILAIFSGTLDRLPRSGDWMIWVKRLMGWVLIGVAVYIIKPLIVYPVFKASLVPFVMIIAGIQLGWLDHIGRGFKPFYYFKKIAGTVICIVGIIYIVSAMQPKEGILWEPYSPEAMSQAIQEKRPVILDFYADWCLPCQELEATIFRDDRVVRFSRQYATLRLDLTHRHPKQNEILDQFGVRGVPTILFFNRNGIEQRDLRIESIVNTRTFLKSMEALWKSVLESSP